MKVNLFSNSISLDINNDLFKDNNSILSPFKEFYITHFEKFCLFFSQLSSFDFNIPFHHDYLKKKLKFIDQSFVQKCLLILNLFFKNNCFQVFKYMNLCLSNSKKISPLNSFNFIDDFDIFLQFESLCKSLDIFNK